MVSDSISLKSQHDISRQYIWSAAMYARKCAEIEKTYVLGSLSEHSKEFEELHMEYKAHAISAIVFSTEFLEAAINRVLADAQDFTDSSAQNYAIWQTIRENWDKNKNNWDRNASMRGTSEILRKFDMVLSSALNPGNISSRMAFYQNICPFPSFIDVDLLINLLFTL